MKKYTSSAIKPLALITVLCFSVLMIGIILIFIDIPIIGVDIGLIMLGGLTGIIFLTGYLAEKNRVLTIDEEKIVFPKGIEINGKTAYSKTEVKFCEISHIEAKLHKGDKITTKDTYFYTLKLKNNTTLTVTLYSFGKEAEKEIFEILYKNIK